MMVAIWSFGLDAAAFLLGENGKVLRDEDFVFYNNLSGRNDAVVHTGDNLTGEGEGDDEVILIDFKKLPDEIKKICYYCYNTRERYPKDKILDKFQMPMFVLLDALMKMI